MHPEDPELPQFLVPLVPRMERRRPAATRAATFVRSMLLLRAFDAEDGTLIPVSAATLARGRG